MQAIINGEMYEVEPAVKVIVDKLMIENAELKKENARLEEGYQKSVGVIAATDCEECKNKVYRKAYNDVMKHVMKIRANIQEIIEDVRRKDGGADNGGGI
jgi:SMC interacting uncharacterized protein involved in chromosome segregation